MRVALVAPRSSIHTVRWANALAERGLEVCLYTLHSGGDPLHPDVRVVTLPIPAPVGYLLNVPILRRHLARFRPDVVHAHFASGYGTLAWASGVRPLVVSVWGSDVYAFPFRSSLHRALLGRILRSAAYICSTSHAMARHVATLYDRLPPIEVIPFGIDVERFVPAEPPGDAPKERAPITIGTVKSLDPRYGIDVLLRAFAEAREVLRRQAPEQARTLRLLVVGDGPSRAELMDLARRLAIDDATDFVGRVPHAEVVRWLHRLDIYVAPSRQESFGVAVLEASACGLPVVVTRVGGLPEVVQDGVTGFVVEPEDVLATAKALVKLVLDERLRAEMGQAGRQWVYQRYSWSPCVARMVDVYRQVIAEASGKENRR